MDFGGHIDFDRDIDDVDDAGLFVDTADHDFILPPTQSRIDPASTQATGPSTAHPASTISASGFSKGALRRRETAAQPNSAGFSQRRVSSPTHRRSLGSGISKPRLVQQPAAVPVSGSLRRSLQETLHRATSMQTLESQMAAMRARLHTVEERLSQIEADSRRTQEDLQLCMGEVSGALEFAESFNHQAE
ncbi:hypothetical protein LTR51_005911 [Lithohypha guttulata]|nr:hypothetical protein LTR51_005911 [Lithohypha guttulata]